MANLYTSQLNINQRGDFMRKEIEKLLNSDITTYKISKDTNINNKTISELRSGKRKLDNITLLTSEKLYEYAKTHLND